MTSVTAHKIFFYCPRLYMQITLFAWLTAKIEKITTEEEIKNYGFFAQYYRSMWEEGLLLLAPFRNQIFDAFLLSFWTHFNAISKDFCGVKCFICIYIV